MFQKFVTNIFATHSIPNYNYFDFLTPSLITRLIQQTRHISRVFARLVLKIQKLAMLLQNLFFIIHHHIHYRKLYLIVG